MDFKPSKNYVALFNNALEIKNIEKMKEIFSELCSEVGLVDAGAMEAQRAAGKAIAEYMNARDQNPGAIKI